MSNKVIISCAITGAMHTPTMSESLPITPAQIAAQSIEAANAGAAIIHLHARKPADGEPTGSPEVYSQFLPQIHDQTDAVINLTTGGSPTMSVADRLSAAIRFKPEMCSLNMGSMNFAIFPAANRIKEWKYAWEEGYVKNSDDFIFRNTFRDIKYILETMSDAGTKFEHECYDVGHLYNLAYFLDQRLVKPPFFVQLIFGILGGIGAAFWCREFSMVGARRRAPSDALPDAGCPHGWQCARRPRGQPVHRARQTGGVERPASPQDKANSAGNGPRGSDARGGAQHAGTEGKAARRLCVTRRAPAPG
jgi:uncharacterized protein (DUF849 family)